MQQVNKYMLGNLLAPLGGTADMDAEIIRFRDFDSNNELLVKQVIRSDIEPYYNSQSALYKASSKRSLAYFLTTDRIDYGTLYDDCLIAFDHPKNPKDFFLWMWDVLFPGQDYHVQNLEDYIEIEDMNEANNYLSL